MLGAGETSSGREGGLVGLKGRVVSGVIAKTDILHINTSVVACLGSALDALPSWGASSEALGPDLSLPSLARLKV